MSLEPYKQIILRLAAVYDHGDRLNPATTKVQCELLRKMCPDPKRAALAAQRYVEDAQNNRYPIPIHKILHALEPPVSDRQNGTAIANRIWESISKFGWPNGPSAREHIGEFGWQVVQMRGGWLAVCEESNESQPGHMLAQLRDLAESLIVRKKAGQGDVRDLKIEGPDEVKRVKELVDGSFKTIPGGGRENGST